MSSGANRRGGLADGFTTLQRRPCDGAPGEMLTPDAIEKREAADRKFEKMFSRYEVDSGAPEYVPDDPAGNTYHKRGTRHGRARYGIR